MGAVYSVGRILGRAGGHGHGIDECFYWAVVERDSHLRAKHIQLRSASYSEGWQERGMSWAAASPLEGQIQLGTSTGALIGAGPADCGIGGIRLF